MAELSEWSWVMMVLTVCGWWQAGAYRVILTHFSQRYPKIPVIGDSRADTTCIAFDLMSVNLAGDPPP